MGSSILDVNAISALTQDLEIGADLRYVRSVDSTNRLARECVNWSTGTTFITDFQHAGRGRRGRSWLAPPESSLLLSILFKIGSDMNLARWTMLGAVSVCSAIHRTTSVQPTIKWPNDVLINNQKCCGILAEHISASEPRVIVGIGINVNREGKRDWLPESATCLEDQTDMRVSREAVAVALFQELSLWYRVFNRQPELLFDRWVGLQNTLGRSVEVVESQSSWLGKAVSVRDDGGLVVRRKDGTTKVVYAADVTVLQSKSFTTG